MPGTDNCTYRFIWSVRAACPTDVQPVVGENCAVTDPASGTFFALHSKCFQVVAAQCSVLWQLLLWRCDCVAVCVFVTLMYCATAQTDESIIMQPSLRVGSGA